MAGCAQPGPAEPHSGHHTSPQASGWVSSWVGGFVHDAFLAKPERSTHDPLVRFTGPIAKVDFADSNTNGAFAGVLPFPGEASIDSINGFALQVAGSIHVPTSGQWTFGVRSDDGSRIRIDGVTQLEDDTPLQRKREGIHDSSECTEAPLQAKAETRTAYRSPRHGDRLDSIGSKDLNARETKLFQIIKW